VTFREFAYGSDDYRAERALRQEVLRRPLGLDLYAEDLAAEKEQWHFGVFDGALLVASVIAAPVGPGEAKIRQMAVAAAAQGRGVGRQLMTAMEVQLRQRGIRHVWLHARLSAAEFYRKLGYVPVGEPFVEVGLPHVQMEKRL
jgi:ribosomal protein S18 acetylase RimI-like enzyme